MDRFKKLRAADLDGAIQRLRRDIADFDARAARESSALERAGRAIESDPLHQRLTSIRDHLKQDLKLAEEERGRRTRASQRKPAWSLRSALSALVGTRA